jgi:hypothetical protein
MPKHLPTMYFATNNSPWLAVNLGDNLFGIKIAWLAVQNHPKHHYVMTMFRDQPYDSLWTRFIRENNVEVYIENAPKNHVEMRRIFQNRKALRYFYHNDRKIKFDKYVEPKQELGGWNGKNMVEHYYLRQDECNPKPVGTDVFDETMIDWTQEEKYKTKGVFISPHERTERNINFTLKFWERVIRTLCSFQIPVLIHSNDLNFMRGFSSPYFSRTYYGIKELTNQIASQHLVLCGNTGTGWLSAATGTNFIAMEGKNHSWSFSSCGCKSLVKTIHKQNIEEVLLTTLAVLKLKGIEGFIKIK